ncbi:C4-dicarboxylate ABC transporter permease [Pseudomonas sp. M30-35]|nr:C4-dicarboxylate ABC transporter permease [Pseudomonas sp. M30-35]
MDIQTISLILLAGIFILLAIGMPLGFASASLAVLVLFLKFGDSVFMHFGSGPLNILSQRIYGLLTDYVLISIPLFIFMANLFERTGIASEMYSSLNAWLSRTRGGIAVVTCIMAVIMAAMSGIIGGEIVLLGLIALPQMLRLGYNQNLAVGTICAGGSLGTMIPPSIVLIMYGLVTETSIKALFTASFLPGFLLAGLYIVYILVRTRLRPEEAPLPEVTADTIPGRETGLLFLTFLLKLTTVVSGLFLLWRALGWATRRSVTTGVDAALLSGLTRGTIVAAGLLLLSWLLSRFVMGAERQRLAWKMGSGLVAPMVVIGVVLGSIYGGITGITEAACMGVVAVLLLGIIRRSLTWEHVWDSLMRTIRATGSILWVTIGATTLAGAYTIAGGPAFIASSIVDLSLSPMGVILVMMLIFLLLGALMDWVGIVLLVMPVFLPVVLKLPAEGIGLIGGIDPQHVAVWFGVLFCMNMQVSFLSPPFGPAAFFLKSVAPAGITLQQIFRSFVPFIAIQVFALLMLLCWPSLVTALL